MSTGEVLALFDYDTAEPVAIQMRSHFEPLTDPRHNFELHRTSSSLGMDKNGDQRMRMLGMRVSDMNSDEASRPHLARPSMIDHVLNEDGDLDFYASTYDEHEYWYGKTASNIWKSAEDIMFKMTPRVSTFKAALNSTLDLERRAFTDILRCMSPRNLIVFVGVSSAYWAPGHDDFDDVGYTTAISAKCGRVRSCPCCSTGCANLLFGPKQTKWTVAIEAATERGSGGKRRPA